MEVRIKTHRAEPEFFAEVSSGDVVLYQTKCFRTEYGASMAAEFWAEDHGHEPEQTYWSHPARAGEGR